MSAQHTLVTAEKARELLAYDPETGHLTWKVYRGGGAPKAGERAGTNHGTGYIALRICGKAYKAHRIAWLIFHGRWPTHDIDHRNGVRSDNRIANLRDVDCVTNCQNRTVVIANSGLLGAHYHGRGRYTSSIAVDGRSHYLGLFSTAEEAHKAYLDAKKALHVGSEQ